MCCYRSRVNIHKRVTQLNQNLCTSFIAGILNRGSSHQNGEKKNKKTKMEQKNWEEKSNKGRGGGTVNGAVNCQLLSIKE